MGVPDFHVGGGRRQRRAARTERAEALGQRARARRDLERLYAEAPDYADAARRLGL